MPASVINVILRRTERGDGGPAGPMTSGPSVIDLENRRFKSIVTKAGWSQSLAKFQSARPFRLEQNRRVVIQLIDIAALIVAWIPIVSWCVGIKFR
ncbi:hypothetical protein [Rhodopseudomonas boonkerdii]|uniref:hypothetical protein n=1 Tax=Rhodopseudomonas boonkerdii TaxID=475937 RepID=UPI001E293376|nr:hypothetical protein [Rhodopseudomonas boonkerdii]